MNTQKLIRELETISDILADDPSEALDHLNLLIDTLADEGIEVKAKVQTKRRRSLGKKRARWSVSGVAR